MSSKCAQCGKTVFFNEKQSYDGKDFHPLCMQNFKKGLKPTLVGYYPGDESRISGSHGNSVVPKSASQPVAGLAGGSYQPSASASASGGGAGGAKFCPTCGMARGAGNFCANCGNKF